MKLLAANRDQGGANAMVPALQLLREQGHDVVTAAEEGCPGWKSFTAAGLAPLSLSDGMPLEGGSLVERVRPDVVLVGIGTFPDAEEKRVIRDATRLGIPSVFIVESFPHLWMGNFWERDRNDYLPATRVLAFDEISSKKFQQEGFSPEQIVITGNPAYDGLAELRASASEIGIQFRADHGIDPEDRVFTFPITNNLPDGQLDIDPGDERWLGHRESDALAEFLLGVELLDRSSFSGARAVVRIKPGRERGPIEEIVQRLSPSSIVIGEEMRDGKPILVASNAVFGTTTLMLQEAVFLGTPAWSYLPNITRKDPCIWNELGITKPLYGQWDLMLLMMEWADDPEALAQAREEVQGGMVLPSDATNRVAEAVTGVMATT